MYEKFQDWCHAQGLSFPCTAGEFYARAVAFAAGDDALIEDLCEQGIPRDNDQPRPSVRWRGWRE
jgi:hypothetical protein